MPDKYLVEFISAFIRQESVRCNTLLNENDGPKAFGLNDDQIRHIVSYNPERILCAIYNELLTLGIDLRRKKMEVDNVVNPPGSKPKDCLAPNPCGTLGLTLLDDQISPMMAASAYQAGEIHPRLLNKKTATVDVDINLELWGNGFLESTNVQFVNGTLTTSTTKDNPPLSCDLDLYQRLKFKAKFTSAGNWKVQVQKANGEWTEGDRPIFIEALPAGPLVAKKKKARKPPKKKSKKV